jgi:hypothetical protein
MDLQSLDSLKSPSWKLARIGALACMVVTVLLLSASLLSAAPHPFDTAAPAPAAFAFLRS